MITKKFFVYFSFKKKRKWYGKKYFKSCILSFKEHDLDNINPYSLNRRFFMEVTSRYGWHSDTFEIININYLGTFEIKNNE